MLHFRGQDFTVELATHIIGGMILGPRLLRVEEAAVYASVGVGYIRKLIKAGCLKAIRSKRTGRYLVKRRDVDACLESLEEPLRWRAISKFIPGHRTPTLFS